MVNFCLCVAHRRTVRDCLGARERGFVMIRVVGGVLVGRIELDLAVEQLCE